MWRIRHLMCQVWTLTCRVWPMTCRVLRQRYRVWDPARPGPIEALMISLYNIMPRCVWMATTSTSHHMFLQLKPCSILTATKITAHITKKVLNVLASRVVLTIFSTEEKYVSHRNCVCWRIRSTTSEPTDRTKLGTWTNKQTAHYFHRRN